MRQTFAYEADAGLLGPLLCPDPVPEQAWEEALLEWNTSGQRLNLLAWLVDQRVADVYSIMDTLSAAAGVPWVEDVRFLSGDEVSDPDGQLLQRQGFQILRSDSPRRLLCGGGAIPPLLENLIGRKAADWQWVLVPPEPAQIQESSPACIEESATQDPPAGLQDWLGNLLVRLVMLGASDIHFERTQERIEVRYHRNGRMEAAGRWSGLRASSMVRLLMTWAGLPSATPQHPQDGRFNHAGHRFRLSRLPTVDGESVVLRTIAGSQLQCDPVQLGIPDELFRLAMDQLRHESGLVLCCGPTGSGKSTTAYCFLTGLEPHGLRMLSIEDPVEREISRAVQSPVDADNGWTFDAAIRAFMRHDPDLIFIGEIRDEPSARAACRCALSGHAVLATLHARDTASALSRLVGWGVERGVLDDIVRVVVNQRLEQDEQALKARFSWQYFTSACADRRRPEPASRALRP